MHRSVFDTEGFGNRGCHHAGDRIVSYKYLMSIRGLETERSYPYVGRVHIHAC